MAGVVAEAVELAVVVAEVVEVLVKSSSERTTVIVEDGGNVANANGTIPPLVREDEPDSEEVMVFSFLLFI